MTTKKRSKPKAVYLIFDNTGTQVRRKKAFYSKKEALMLSASCDLVRPRTAPHEIVKYTREVKRMSIKMRGPTDTERAERYAMKSIAEVQEVLTNGEYTDYFSRAVAAYKAGLSMGRRLMRDSCGVRKNRRKGR